MKNIKRIVTCEAENLLWQETDIEPKAQEDCMHVINVYPQVKYQTIDRFSHHGQDPHRSLPRLPSLYFRFDK